jgi:hypothetical protein
MSWFSFWRDPTPLLVDLQIQIARQSGKIDNLNRQLSDIAAAQSAQTALLQASFKQGVRIMSDLDDDLAAIKQQGTMIAGLQTFVEGIEARVTAVPNLTDEQQAKIDEIFTEINANNDLIAKAMVVNTPAANVPVDQTASPAAGTTTGGLGAAGGGAGPQP